MVCKQCGAELKWKARFCGKCGAEVTEEWSALESVRQMTQAKREEPSASAKEVSQQIFQAKQEESSASAREAEQQIFRSEQEVAYIQKSEYRKVFIEPDEQLQGTLGNGYLENILHKKVKKCHALLTDRRVYLQGTFFSGSGKSLQEDLMEKIVDLEDITGTGFRYSKPLGILSVLITYIVSMIVSMIAVYISRIGHGGVPEAVAGFVIASLITIVRYLKNRKTDFIIEYAGGFIRFDATIIGLSNVRDFQKQIRRAKDHVKGKR